MIYYLKLATKLNCNDDPDRCPVEIFLKYISLCPIETLNKALYLLPLRKPTGEAWYGKTPVGHNTLSNMVKTMMMEAGYNGQYTNHSLRVTTVTRLFDNKEDIKVVKMQTGHRSDALLAYRRIDDDIKKNVSRVLTRPVKMVGEPSTTGSESLAMVEEPRTAGTEQCTKKIKLEHNKISNVTKAPLEKNLKEHDSNTSRFVFNISGGNVTFNF